MHCFHYQIVRYFEDLAAYCIVLYLVDWTKSAQREIFSAALTTAIEKIQSTVQPMRKVNTSFWNMDFIMQTHILEIFYAQLMGS